MTKKPTIVKQTLRLYWQHVKPRRYSLLLLCSLTAIAVISGQVMTPYITSLVLDKLSRAGTHNITQFYPFLVAYFCALITELVAWRIMIYIVWKFEIDIMQEIAERCFSHLMYMSNRFHTNRFGGALVSQANKFVGSFERLSDTFFFEIVTFATYFVSVIAVLATRVPVYAGLLVLGSIIYFVVLSWRSKLQQPLNIAEAQSESARTAQLADSITNITTIKVFGHELRERHLFKIKAAHTTRQSLLLRSMTLKNDTFFNSLTSVISWMALFFAVIAVGRYHAHLGTVLLIFSYTGLVLRRLWESARSIRNINRAFGDAHDMTEILMIEPEIKDAPNAQTFTSTEGSLAMHDVTFAYAEQPDKPLFKNFDLSVKAGEKVGLVGHSGSGKTTITKLLLRFMDITGGSIAIDGHDIKKMTQESLRRNIAYVPQEPLMFHRTISENIRYGQLDATDEQVEQAARFAHAHEFIQNLPNGYETLVGERGTKLSGGQRQRVAIARAMLKNAPILVLDEATSALDSESEALIQDALWKLMEGRTAIVIAHRLSTIQKMDRIVVLEDGKIIEEGSHKHLLSQGGTYADLWNRQSGGFIEE